MHSNSTPKQTFKELYSTCIGTTKDPRHIAFNNKLADLIGFCQLYDQKMKDHLGNEIQPITTAEVSPLNLNDYINLYNNKLLKTEEARKFYDDLLAKGKEIGCCYCSYGDVEEIDHLLPETRYAQYSIYPKNLIPSCHRCNRKKWGFWPSKQPDNFIHPYFEDYSNKRWLDAEVIFLTGQPVVRYSISQIDFSDASIPIRIENQFNRLELGERYSVQAGRETRARKQSTFKSLFDNGGKSTLVNWLTIEYNDQFNIDKNSWKTLAYKAFLGSKEFCDFQW